MTKTLEPGTEVADAREAQPRRAPAQGGQKRRRRSAFATFLTRHRRPFVLVHRWLSLVLGIWILIVSLTGVILVFQDRIDAFLRPELNTSTPGDVGPQAVLDAAERRHPDWTLDGASMPSVTGGVYRIYMYTGADGEEYHTVYVDPGTAEVNGQRRDGEGFTATVYWLHTNLMQTEVLGVDGMDVVAWLALAWLLTLLAGFYVWYWPGVKRWARALRGRRSRGKFTFSMDLHKSVGIVAFVPLVAIILTGINFAFYDPINSVVTDIVGEERIWEPPANRTLSKGDPADGHVNADEALVILERRFPNGKVAFIGQPPADDKKASIVAWVSSGWDPWNGLPGYAGNVLVHIDQYTGRFLYIGDPKDFSVITQFYEEWAFPIHAGSFGGTPTRIVWLFVGLTPTVLFVTGVSMYMIRRRKRRAANGNSEAGQAQEVAR